MRDDVEVDCDVAREALSARLDGERAHVPTRQVDAHLESCPECRAWLIGASEQARKLASLDVEPGPDLIEQIMATAGVHPVARYRRWPRWAVSQWRRCALIGVGGLQVALGVAQIAGIDFGMVSTSGHSALTGAHLMHESTAWSLALGVGMIAAGVWTAAAVGMATVQGVFAVALLAYVVGDAWDGQVTAARIASHLPVLLGLVFALLVARGRAGSRNAPDAKSAAIVPPAGARRGRRRGHLWPTHRSAA
jgi:predicted anti-sigma-YlaC factor YlaD